MTSLQRRRLSFSWDTLWSYWSDCPEWLLGLLLPGEEVVSSVWFQDLLRLFSASSAFVCWVALLTWSLLFLRSTASDRFVSQDRLPPEFFVETSTLSLALASHLLKRLFRGVNQLLLAYCLPILLRRTRCYFFTDWCKRRLSLCCNAITDFRISFLSVFLFFCIVLALWSLTFMQTFSRLI